LLVECFRHVKIWDKSLKKMITNNEEYCKYIGKYLWKKDLKKIIKVIKKIIQ